jgi:hypothetical protein
MGKAVQSDGHEYGMWAAGMAVYCASCTMANFWLVMRFHQHDTFSTISFVLMLAAPFVFYWLFATIFKNNYISKEFGVQANAIVFLSYLLTLGYIIVWELGRNQRD